MAEKLCTFCKHFHVDGGERGYSEMTPGYGAVIECWLGKWELDNGYDTARFRDYISYAATCDKYEVGK